MTPELPEDLFDRHPQLRHLRRRECIVTPTSVIFPHELHLLNSSTAKLAHSANPPLPANLLRPANYSECSLSRPCPLPALVTSSESMIEDREPLQSTISRPFPPMESLQTTGFTPINRFPPLRQPTVSVVLPAATDRIVSDRPPKRPRKDGHVFRVGEPAQGGSGRVVRLSTQASKVYASTEIEPEVCSFVLRVRPSTSPTHCDSS